MTIDPRLSEGYRHFRQDRFQKDRALYEDLATMGQSPHTLLIACSDSRVLPQHILDAGPGELFVVRNVAAMVPPYETDEGHHGTSAAIEFAVTVLGVRNIVVMGHTGCGGVKHVADGHACPDQGAPGFVSQWMAPLDRWVKAHEASLAKAPASRAHMLERAAVYLSAQNLRDFPFVQQRIDDGSLTVCPTLFDIHTGNLSFVKESAEGHYELSPFA